MDGYRYWFTGNSHTIIHFVHGYQCYQCYQPTKKHCCPLTCARLTGYGAFAPHAILADLLKQERNGQAPLSIASAVPLGKEFWVYTQQAKSPSHNSLVSGSGIFWKHVLWMRFVYMCFVVAATASVVLR